MFRQDNNIKMNLKGLRFYECDSVPERKKNPLKSPMFRPDNNIKMNLKVLRFYGGDSVPEGKKNHL